MEFGMLTTAQCPDTFLNVFQFLAREKWYKGINRRAALKSGNLPG